MRSPVFNARARRSWSKRRWRLDSRHVRLAVVSADTESAVELFLHREDAERMLEEAFSDEPGWADVLTLADVPGLRPFKRREGGGYSPG